MSEDKTKFRLRIVGVVCIAIEVALLLRIGLLHANSNYRKLVEKKATLPKTIPATRGTIYDRYFRIIACDTGFKRLRINGLARELVGYTSIDRIGLAGIEYKYEKYLRGKKGFEILGRTPRGRLYLYPGYKVKQPVPGANIVLTIDRDIQEIIETVIQDKVKAFGAKSGSVIVMNPKTGEILGMATYPHNVSRNRVISDMFEPGSTFKIVTLASVLANDIAHKDDIVENGASEIQIGDKIIRDEKKHGKLTLAEATWISSNVAFVKLAFQLTRKEFYKFAKLFGFGTLTGINLPGESPGKFNPYQFRRDFDFATLAFGQGIGCTLLQLALAYQCIANNGVLMRPLVIKEITSYDGKVIYASRPQKLRRVIDPTVAAELNEILSGVIEHGTGRNARIPGIKIAGKTGTAQKAINGRYAPGKYVSTFVGYFPLESPEILIACMLDEPKYGESAQVCAPIFRIIGKKILNLKRYRKIRRS